MTLHILDTNITTLLTRGVEPVTSRIIARPPQEVVLTVITVQESLDGWHALLRKAKRREQIEFAYARMIETVQTLARFRLLNFTQRAIARFDALLRMKLNVGGNDLRIAAIALEHQATVVTANERDFTRVPGLPVEDWTV